MWNPCPEDIKTDIEKKLTKDCMTTLDKVACATLEEGHTLEELKDEGTDGVDHKMQTT